MNKGDKLKSMTNEERAKVITQIAEESVRAGVVIYDGILALLNTPTGHEAMLADGWEVLWGDNWEVCYKFRDGEGFSHVEFYKSGRVAYAFSGANGECLTPEVVEKMRIAETHAEEIRKERRWE